MAWLIGIFIPPVIQLEHQALLGSLTVPQAGHLVGLVPIVSTVIHSGISQFQSFDCKASNIRYNTAVMILIPVILSLLDNKHKPAPLNGLHLSKLIFMLTFEIAADFTCSQQMPGCSFRAEQKTGHLKSPAQLSEQPHKREYSIDSFRPATAIRCSDVPTTIL